MFLFVVGRGNMKRQGMTWSAEAPNTPRDLRDLREGRARTEMDITLRDRNPSRASHPLNNSDLSSHNYLTTMILNMISRPQNRLGRGREILSQTS